MDERAVVTCFLRHGTEVLLVRRGESVGSYPGKWGGVSGFAEGTPHEAARWEIAEEVDLLTAVTQVRSADPIPVEDDDRGTRWLVHPYLFDCESTDVTLNEELVDYEWVQPPEILRRETVPKLWAAYAAVAPSVESVRADTDHGSAYISLRALEVLRDRAAVAAERGDGDYGSLARDLRDARPSMGAVVNRINRVMATAETTPESVLEAATEACQRAVNSDAEAAEAAMSVLGERVLTLSRSGTVLDALREATPEAVYVAESRPAREGVDAADELADAGLDVTVFVDAAVAEVIRTEDVDTVLFGADTVLSDGTVVNKVGSHPAALAAETAGVDCYAVCSRDKIVPGTEADREPGPPNAVYDGDADVGVLNPTFEAVPAERLDGVITEDGPLSASDVAAVADEHAALAEWPESAG
ncbi:NUDIX domain-containing protein [Natronomonas halophila]|uniref:NUDIX domain-containing protein n=1 Tax=Natronomonas halophila TaxID=2747817 RepID=UPI0015B3F4BD|nr:NUDIX domain-containing protein [Natronomonas halophila]QLD85619.1 NUDIX domain-containing protein [Natronomonas halophila]